MKPDLSSLPILALLMAGTLIACAPDTDTSARAQLSGVEGQTSAMHTTGGAAKDVRPRSANTDPQAEIVRKRVEERREKLRRQGTPEHQEQDGHG